MKHIKPKSDQSKEGVQATTHLKGSIHWAERTIKPNIKNKMILINKLMYLGQVKTKITDDSTRQTRSV